MEDSQKLKKKFDELKTAVSNHYPGERYKQLRCCLYGIIHGADLNKTGVGCYLFNALEVQGVISPTNVKLLAEITELTDVKGAINCVKKYKRDNNVEDSEGKILTPYRRGLVKALMCAGEDELNNVVGNYKELNPYTFDNLWDAVLELEREKLLENNPDSIKRFVNLLKEDTKTIFQDMQGGPSASSTNQHSTSSGPSASTISPANQYSTSSGLLTSSTSSNNQHSTSTGPSVSTTFPTNQHSTSSGSSVSSQSPANQQDERIRKYLLEHQKIKCSNYNRFTPPIMQSRFEVDIAHMFTDLDLLKEMKDGKENVKKIHLDELMGIIKEKPACKVLIEGEGGIGKTTLLRYLAYNWSTEKSDIKQPFKGKIVFLINIRDIGEGEDILDVVVKHIKLKDFKRKARLPEDPDLIEQFIVHHDDEIVLMLDGLDEIKTGSESPISLFEKQEFQRSFVILTSRSENINEYIRNSDVHVKVKGFSEEKVEEYIKKYFKCDSETGDSLFETLSNGGHPELWSMCRNPMLLLLTCIMWKNRQEIPSDKCDLFREIFRCIINQYNKDESKPKIHMFEDIPKQHLSAMCLLGHCMYHRLKKNQLSINKKELVANEALITIALKLGFVYKEESYLETSFEEIYAAPHKLIVESLVGFYLYKLCEGTVDMPTNLSLDDNEWEKIRENGNLENARKFAIGFLGANAGKFLKNWITNSISTCCTLCKYYIPLVKQEHVGTVMKALIDYLANSNLEIKQYIPDVCRSLRLWIDHINPNAGVDEDKHIFHLITEVYNSEKLKEIYRFINTMSLREKEKGQFLAHILLPLEIQSYVWQTDCITLNEKEAKYFTDECKKLDIKNDSHTYTCTAISNPLYLVHVLTHSRGLRQLQFRCNGDTGNFLKNTINSLHNIEGCALKLQYLNVNDNNLSNISGTSLALLMGILPKLSTLYMGNCNLTGDTINDMMTHCSSLGIRLFELKCFKINNNNFSNLNGTSLASLMEISPKLSTLDMENCKLKGDVINNMMTDCSSRGIKLLELDHLYISDNNFSNINGTSLATLMEISPKLSTLDMENCKLKGDVINDMITECSSRGIKFLELYDLHINYNNLSKLNGTSLASLMEISPKLSTLDMENCKLKGDVINNMMTDCSSRDIKLLKLHHLNISNNKFSSLNDTSLTSLMEISPKLSTLDMHKCTLTGDVINDMMTDCSSRGIKLLELDHLYISDNNFSNINGTSLATLMEMSPMVNTLTMQNCNLTGNVINDMMTDCSRRGIKLLELKELEISDNNFSNIDGKTLASLMEISPQLRMLNIKRCNLTGDIINDMMTDCSSRGIKLLDIFQFNISYNNFSSIRSTSPTSLMDILPKAFHALLVLVAFILWLVMTE